MKYEGETTIQKVKDFTWEMSSVTTTFWKHCSIHHIACLLGVTRSTIYEWMKKYPDFSDTIKRWEDKRNALFLELPKKDGAWIFIAKNWLDMRDNQAIEHGGEIKTDSKLTVEVVHIGKHNTTEPNKADE